MYPENSVNSSVGSIYHPTLKNFCLEERFSFNNLRQRNIGKRTMLEFNIGPSFLHMIFYNNFTGRSFSYLFDSSNCVSSNIFKDKAKQLNDIETTLNTEQSHLLKVNIFKEKCGCEKCLSASFPFYSCQPVYLTNELVQVLKSEHCSNWNRCWIEMVLEQMFVFFSCIKNGVIYERLLECACVCANMLVMKHSNTHLLEYKYSYKYFVEKLIANFQLVCKYRNNNYGIRDHSIYCGREIGKVYFDVVENFAIMTFETEKEMNAYTEYENQIKKTRPQYFINSFRKCITGCNDFVGTKSKKCIKSKVKEIASNKLRLRVVKRSEGAANGRDDDKTVCVNHQKQFNDKAMENQSKYERTFVNRETITLSNNNNISGLATTVTNRNQNENNFMETGSRDSNETAAVKWNRIQVMHGCNRRQNNIVQCTCKSFSLGMLLNLGTGRALPKQTVENLKLLENNEATVTCRLATIAASALLNDEQTSVRRMVVPVVLSDIVNLAKHFKLPRNMNDSKVIDKDVLNVLNDLLDQVCFSESDLCSGSVHSELLNASNSLKESLEEDADRTSANKTLTVMKGSDQEQNIDNISKLSKRSKREIKMSSRFINSVFFDEASLPLASSVFQGSRSLGTQRRMEFVCDERKRKRKLKVKSIGDECLKGKIELTRDVCKKRKFELNNDLCKKQKMDLIIDAWKKRGSSTVLRKLDFSVGNIDEKRTLADILIWCGYHDKYNCPCILSVCRMKHNLVIWEPPKILKYVTHKVMSKVDIDIREKESCEVYFFDSEEFCARSYGAPLNYSLRNNSQLFSAKRRYELENNVTTSTNSFIKFKYSVFKSVFNMGDDGTEQYGDVIRYECKENLYMVADEQEIHMEIDVDIGVGGAAADIIVISDNEEDAMDQQQHSISSVALSNIDLEEPNINSDGQRTKHNNLWRNNKSASPKTYLKSKKNVLDKSEHCNQQTDNNKLDGNLIRNSNIEENMERDNILDGDLQRYNNISEIEVNVKTPLKQLKTYLFQQNSIDITNYDSSLENGLLRLKDHPLKDDIYCCDENKLPKLALYCVTPGIGYLPIVEYTAKALVVFDPIFPEVLHSFKNLSTANMWLNKFLKDFLVFESIDISLKWIIVKPGIIKMKQSQPFSPAIFENSPIIITKDGEIRFSKKEVIGSFDSKRQEIGEYKRKLIADTVVDINGSDGKRKKIHLDCLGPVRAKILTRTVNLLQQYPSKKSTILPTLATTPTTLQHTSTTHQLNQNQINSELNNCSPLKNNITPTLNTANNVETPFGKQLKISPTKHYQLIPANLLIEMNVPSTLLNGNNNNNNNNLVHSKYGYISSSSCGLTNASTSSDGRSSFILTNNNEMIITSENPTQMLH